MNAPKPTPEALRTAAANIHNQYRMFFAGHARISRDAALLTSLADQADALLKVVETTSGEGVEAIKNELVINRDLYRSETKAILEAQAAGPLAVEGHHLAALADLTFLRYKWHFAGRARATRDLALLGEMLSDLEEANAALEDLAKDYDDDGLKNARAEIGRYLEMLRTERGLIATAREAGTLQEQSSVLATLANDQFKLYADHFAGKVRLARRPGLLERMISNLTEIAERMAALKAQGLHAEFNDKNIEVVKERIKGYREELTAIRSAKASTANPGELVNALALAANEQFELYAKEFAGQPRNNRDVDRLVVLLEGLTEVLRQMEDLERLRSDPDNARNRQIVLDRIRKYDEELDLIREAQKPKA